MKPALKIKMHSHYRDVVLECLENIGLKVRFTDWGDVWDGEWVYLYPNATNPHVTRAGNMEDYHPDTKEFHIPKEVYECGI